MQHRRRCVVSLKIAGESSRAIIFVPYDYNVEWRVDNEVLEIQSTGGELSIVDDVSAEST